MTAYIKVIVVGAIMCIAAGLITGMPLIGVSDAAGHNPAADRIQINADVSAVLDHEHGNVCYYAKQGGISCVPMIVKGMTK